MRRLSSDLDLNGNTPVQVRPDVGSWSPRLVPTTGAKKRARWLVVAVFASVVLVVSGAYWWFVSVLTTG